MSPLNLACSPFICFVAIPPKRDFIRENVISLQQLKHKQTNNRNEANQGKLKGARISRSTSNPRFAFKSDASIANKKNLKNGKLSPFMSFFKWK